MVRGRSVEAAGHGGPLSGQWEHRIACSGELWCGPEGRLCFLCHRVRSRCLVVKGPGEISPGPLLGSYSHSGSGSSSPSTYPASVLLVAAAALAALFASCRLVMFSLRGKNCSILA